jgi:hypothetical protein
MCKVLINGVPAVIRNGMSGATNETFSNYNYGRAKPSAARLEMVFQSMGGEKNHKASLF